MTERYENGKIYKIVNMVDDDFYIGSTCLPLHKRFHIHKRMWNSRNKETSPIYAHADNIGDWCKFKIVLVEEYPCKDVDQLRQREQYWIDELQPTLNKYRAYRSAEYEKKYQRERCKKYRLLVGNERRRQKMTCESCGVIMNISTKGQHEKTKFHIASTV